MRILFLLLFLLTQFCFSQEKNCSNFKTGEFKYVLKSMPEKIIRTDSTQIEINPVDGVEIYASIIWTSDCTYVLTYQEIRNYPEDVSDYIGQKIFVEILETSGNWYKVRAKSNRMEEEIEFIKTN